MVMKDPKVTELVKQFNKDIAALNKTWAALQKHDVYARVSVVGTSTYTEPKYIEVTEITQHVPYMKEDT
jgi:hypothetical protein